MHYLHVIIIVCIAVSIACQITGAVKEEIKGNERIQNVEFTAESFPCVALSLHLCSLLSRGDSWIQYRTQSFHVT